MPSSVTATLAPMAGHVRKDVSLTDLLKATRGYVPSGDWPAAEKLIGGAADFAVQAHHDQLRHTGEAFVQHPIAVAFLLADLHLDPETIAAALLHDCVEDTSAKLETIRDRFGSTVADLVDGVTKLSDISVVSLDDEQAQNLRKVFLAMARDIRVVLIKLADRLHNVQSAEVYEEKKRSEYAIDTLEIFAPLAGRLGIEEWRWRLEDHAFRVLKPARYREIARWLVDERQAREEMVTRLTDELRIELDNAGISALIQSRVKHLYSIEQKTQRKNVTLDELYDIVAVRVIVDDLAQCYAALGVVHGAWRHIPSEFDDYISAPKENGYSSIHTAVLGPDARPLEIQIRTHEMHAASEYGVAAHWRYKSDEADFVDTASEKLAWVRQILSWQAEDEPAGSFVDAIKTDFFSDMVFAFSPHGKVMDFPAGSTPLDFAYRIHSDVGHTCIGAKVNGRLVQLDYELVNGDVVQILTSGNSPGPSRNWISIVHTAHARDKIRQWFKRRERAENVESGKELLERELRRLGHGRVSQVPGHDLKTIAADLGYSTVEGLFAGVGYGATTVSRVINRLQLTSDVSDVDGEFVRTDTSGVDYVLPFVRVLGVVILLSRFASCCNPLPGDQIVGYITRGHGVSVHQSKCHNVHDVAEPERLVKVEWSAALVGSDHEASVRLASCCSPRPGNQIVGVVAADIVEAHRARCRLIPSDSGDRVEVWWIDQADQSLPVQIRIVADDREGLTHDVSGVIREEGLNISSAQITTDRRGQATLRVTVGLSDVAKLARLVRRIESVPGVFSVARDRARRRRVSE